MSQSPIPSDSSESREDTVLQNVYINALDQAQKADVTSLAGNALILGGQLALDSNSTPLRVLGGGGVLAGAVLSAGSLYAYLQSTGLIGNMNLPEGHMLFKGDRIPVGGQLETGLADAQLAYPGAVVSAILFNTGMYLLIHSGGNPAQNAVGVTLVSLGAIAIYGMKSGTHFVNSWVQYGSDQANQRLSEERMQSPRVRKMVEKNRRRLPQNKRSNNE